MQKNYSVTEIGSFHQDLAEKKRIMVGENLGLTGCEISLNYAHAGTFAPFVHSHKLNEEVYLVISGSGLFMVDGEEFAVKEGSIVRVAPQGQRAIMAKEDMAYLCIQAEAGSLTQATEADGVLNESKASWMQG